MSNLFITRACYLVTFHNGAFRVKEIPENTYVLSIESEPIADNLLDSLSAVYAKITSEQNALKNLENSEQDAVFKYIQSQPLGVTNSDLCFQFRKIKSGKMSELKRNLENSGLVFMYKGTSGANGGRPSVRWFAHPAPIADNSCPT